MTTSRTNSKMTLGDYVILAVLLFLVVAVLVGGWAGRSYFEARAFNNATGRDVSTWDAMWIELRVQANPGDDDGRRP